MNCNHCGVELEDNANFCPRCGEAASVDEEEDIVVATCNCGGTILRGEDDKSKCVRCGQVTAVSGSTVSDSSGSGQKKTVLGLPGIDSTMSGPAERKPETITEALENVANSEDEEDNQDEQEEGEELVEDEESERAEVIDLAQHRRDVQILEVPKELTINTDIGSDLGWTQSTQKAGVIIMLILLIMAAVGIFTCFLFEPS